MTKQEMAVVFARQLKMHGITVPIAVLEDAAAQVLTVLMCEQPDRWEDIKQACADGYAWRPSDAEVAP